MHNQSFTLTSREISTLAKGVSIEIVDTIRQFVSTIKESDAYKDFPYNFKRADDYLFSQLESLMMAEEEYNLRVKEAENTFNYRIEQMPEVQTYVQEYNRHCSYGKEIALDRTHVSLKAKNVYEAYVSKIRNEVFNLDIPCTDDVYSLAKAMILAEYKSLKHINVKNLLSEVYDNLLEKYIKNDFN